MVRGSVWDIWRRAESGPVCPVRRFETEVYWKRLKELVKEYGIRYDQESVVPTDNSLIADTFKAGIELLLDVGVLCIDTERIIKLEENEIKEALRSLPGQVVLGEGKDSVIMVNRKLNDKKSPVIQGGPTATPVSEEFAVKIYMSYMKEPVIDTFWPGTIKVLDGIPVKAGSPMEINAEIRNLSWMREALMSVGRPGMHLQGSPAVSVAADIAGSSQEYGWRKSDGRCVWLLPHLKTNYAGLSRALHFLQYGCPAVSWGTGFIGGLAGGPEGAVITTVAETIAAITLYKTNLDYVGPINAMYTGTSDRMTMWANFLSNAAVNEYSNHLSIGEGPFVIYAGPCTDMCLYEIAAVTIGIVVVGSSPFGPAPRQGVHTDYCTGLESKFMGEVAHAVTEMSRDDANSIVKMILEKYESRIKRRIPPQGKKFQECYDVHTITPSKEYTELYERIKRELEEIGVEFKTV